MAVSTAIGGRFREEPSDGENSNGTAGRADFVLAQFEELVRDPVYRGWAFRGQNNGELPLLSGLSRYLMYAGVHRDAWAGQEERILRIFQRKAHLFLDHIPPESDSFQWLGLMQHHGAPTRLLDLTWSPYVAAFFALERGVRNRRCGHSTPPRSTGRTRSSWSDGRTVDLRPIGMWMERSYENHFLHSEVPFAVIGEPKVMNHRLVGPVGHLPHSRRAGPARRRNPRRLQDQGCAGREAGAGHQRTAGRRDAGRCTR